MPKKKRLPSYNELVDKIQAICPNAELEEDDEGQIIVKTGFTMDGDEDDPLEPIAEIDEDAEYGDEDDDEDDDDSDDDEDEDLEDD